MTILATASPWPGLIALVLSVPVMWWFWWRAAHDREA